MSSPLPPPLPPRRSQSSVAAAPASAPATPDTTVNSQPQSPGSPEEEQEEAEFQRILELSAQEHASSFPSPDKLTATTTDRTSDNTPTDAPALRRVPPAPPPLPTRKPTMSTLSAREIEDLQIVQYLQHFGKHVSSVSALPTAQAAFQSFPEKPRLADYVVRAGAGKEVKVGGGKVQEEGGVSEGGEETKNGAAEEQEGEKEKDGEKGTDGEKEKTERPSEPSPKKNSGRPVPGGIVDEPEPDFDEGGAEAVDWIAFGFATLIYTLETHLPLDLDESPLQPFRYGKLASNLERLYVVIRASPLEAGGRAFFELIMWRNRLHTFLALCGYLLLVSLDLLPTVLLLAITGALLARHFAPPSRAVLVEEVEETGRRAEEAAEIEESLGGDGAVPGRREKGLRNAYQKVVRGYGREIQMVSGDLADFFEKVKNLYLWRSPRSTWSFIMRVLLPPLLAVRFLSHAALVRLSLAGLGLVLFLVVPLQVNFPRYRRISWNLADVPTDAQFVLSVLRARAAAGEPLPVIPPALPKPKRSKSALPAEDGMAEEAEEAKEPKGGWKKFASTLQKGGRMAERGSDVLSQVMSGDRGVFLKMAGLGGESEIAVGQDSTPSTPTSAKSGLTLQRSATLPAGSTTSHFALYRSPGTLVLSSSEILFRPFSGANLSRPLQEVEGVRKTTSLRLGVAVSGGLEVRFAGGEVLRFAGVARRDEAFNRLVATANHVWVNA